MQLEQTLKERINAYRSKTEKQNITTNAICNPEREEWHK